MPFAGWSPIIVIISSGPATGGFESSSTSTTSVDPEASCAPLDPDCGPIEVRTGNMLTVSEPAGTVTTPENSPLLADCSGKSDPFTFTETA